MKTACIVLTLVISVAIMAICVMVKFATDVTVDERSREFHLGGGVYRLTKTMGVIALSDNTSSLLAERFPYVAAIIKNSSSSWSFACFASIVLVKWVVTSAHCRSAGSTHRVLLYHSFVRNYTQTYPLLFWRLHEKYNASHQTPQYDIAVAKLNVNSYPFSLRPSVFDDKGVFNVLDASIWKTVSSMDRKMYLTNDIDKFEGLIVNSLRCFESYGYAMDISMVCVDFSHYEDCFSHEFGPLYDGDKVAGILAVKPRDCDVKYAIFTNVSYYAPWILKSTSTTYYG